MAEGIRQEAFAALNQQEQARVQQQEQDRAQAEAAINQVHREALGVINETRGAANRERQERMRMEAGEKQLNKQSKKPYNIKATNKIDDEMYIGNLHPLTEPGPSQKLKLFHRRENHRPIY